MKYRWALEYLFFQINIVLSLKTLAFIELSFIRFLYSTTRKNSHPSHKFNDVTCSNMHSSDWGDSDLLPKYRGFNIPKMRIIFDSPSYFRSPVQGRWKPVFLAYLHLKVCRIKYDYSQCRDGRGVRKRKGGTGQKHTNEARRKRKEQVKPKGKCEKGKAATCNLAIRTKEIVFWAALPVSSFPAMTTSCQRRQKNKPWLFQVVAFLERGRFRRGTRTECNKERSSFCDVESNLFFGGGRRGCSVESTFLDSSFANIFGVRRVFSFDSGKVDGGHPWRFLFNLKIFFNTLVCTFIVCW